jgi:hypothetical protein
MLTIMLILHSHGCDVQHPIPNLLNDNQFSANLKKWVLMEEMGIYI